MFTEGPQKSCTHNVEAHIDCQITTKAFMSCIGCICTGTQKTVQQMRRVGQNHIYTVYIRYFWQGNHRIYGHIWCIYTVLANPTNALARWLSTCRSVAAS